MLLQNPGLSGRPDSELARVARVFVAGWRAASMALDLLLLVCLSLGIVGMALIFYRSPIDFHD